VLSGEATKYKIYSFWFNTDAVTIRQEEFEFEFWCLMPLSAIFQLYHGNQF